MLFADFTEAAITTIRLQGDGYSSSSVINSHRRAISVSKPLQHVKTFWKRHIQKPASNSTEQLLRKSKSSSLFRNSFIFISDMASLSPTRNSFFSPSKRRISEDPESDLPYEGFTIFETDGIKK